MKRVPNAEFINIDRLIQYQATILNNLLLSKVLDQFFFPSQSINRSLSNAALNRVDTNLSRTIEKWNEDS